MEPRSAQCSGELAAGKGNLTSDEAAVMKDMLYTLRMKYVEAASGKNPTS
ncbi:MAG: DUF1844 domain-containing protein [Nitrospirales bacterium]